LEEMQTKNEENKAKKDKDRDRGNTTKCQIFFSFCVHLAHNGDINDRPVSVDQSCLKLQHSHDGTILKECDLLYV
jgi:hypothetical protein